MSAHTPGPKRGRQVSIDEADLARLLADSDRIDWLQTCLVDYSYPAGNCRVHTGCIYGDLRENIDGSRKNQIANVALAARAA